MADDAYGAEADETVHESAGQLQPEAKPTADGQHDQAIVQEVIDHVADVLSYENAQRQSEDDALEFEGVSMWTPEALDARSEQTDEATGQKIPARPAIEINLVEQKIQTIMSEARQARLGIVVQPKAGLANTKQAGYYKGLIRSIQADSGATEVRLWALERASKCGRGAYRVDVDYANEGEQGDESGFDLDIVYRRILDQSTVYWDLYSVMADKSDALRVVMAEWVSEKERVRRWPTKPIIAPEGAFESASHPWFTINDDKQKSCLIATMWKVEFDEQVLAHHPKVGVIGPMALDAMPSPMQQAIGSGHESVRSRKVPKRRVMQYIVDGSQVLERDPWPSRNLPVFPVIGKEYVVRGKRSYKGLVNNIMGLNRGYNVTISSAVEAVGSIPRAPYIMYAGQDENFEEMWDDSPIRAFTRLYINPTMIGDKPAPFPQRQNLEPAIQGALLLARVLKDDVNSVAGTVDPAARAVRPYDRSGRAIEALQKQGAAGTSNYLDNLALITMPHEGRTLVDMIPKVYDRKGRIIAVMGEENDDETAVILGVPFVRDGDGNPIPVPCPTCKGTGERRDWLLQKGTCPTCQGEKAATDKNAPKEWQGQPVEYVNLQDGQFKVSVNIGRAWLNKQEEAMSAMSELSQSAPSLVPVYADLWVRSMGFPGSVEIADRIKRMNPHAADEKGGKQIPPEFAAKFQALQQEHEAAMQALQKATQALQTDQVKRESDRELLAMKLEAATGLEHVRAQARLMETTAKGDASKEIEQMKGQLASMLQESEQRHEQMLETVTTRHAQVLEAIRSETKLAVAEETAKSERTRLFLEERRRLGVEGEATTLDDDPKGGGGSGGQ